jgi:hypothetical protein
MSGHCNIVIQWLEEERLFLVDLPEFPWQQFHSDYIHYNPVAYGLCRVPQEWQFSSLHRLMAMGVYEANWGMDERGVEVPSWDESLARSQLVKNY